MRVKEKRIEGERFRQIKGYEEYYVSRDGQVYSARLKRCLKLNQRRTVNLRREDGTFKQIQTSQLVFQMWAKLNQDGELLLEGERFRRIKNFEDYFISMGGRVYSTLTTRYIRPGKMTSGYLMCALMDNKNRRRNVSIHRLVYQAWLGNLEPGLEINHINGDKTDNRTINLEQVTSSENKKHAVQFGLHNGPRGCSHPDSKFNEDEVREIRRAVRSGASQIELAKMFGVSYTTINSLANYKTYKSII